MKKKGKKAAFFVNTILAMIIVGLYLILISPYAVDAVAASGFPIYKGNRTDRIAIQCSVTWDAAAIPAILDVLAEKNIHITFAISGEWAERNIACLRRMAEDGHEIATLGYDPTLEGNLMEIKEDVSRSLEIIKDVTGKEPSLFCFVGRNSGVCARAASQLGLTSVIGTLDLVCAHGTAGDILNRAVGNTNSGDILITAPTAAFAQALPDILDHFVNQGLTVATIGSTIYS